MTYPVKTIFFFNESQNILNEFCLPYFDYKFFHFSSVSCSAVDTYGTAGLLNENKIILVCAPSRSADPSYDDKRL